MSTTLTTRLGAGVAAALLGIVTLSGTAASAHVRVDDGSAPSKGGYGVVRLVVPTESDTASTVGLSVTFPDDVDVASARVLPQAGWTASVAKDGERVSAIVWKADDPATGGIGPSEFGIFTFSGGPWPADQDTVALPTTQTYSDGTQVVWDEVALDAESEPEHPSPVVALGAASADHHGGAASTEQAAAGADGGDLVQWGLTGLALVLSGVAAWASLSRRREAAPVPTAAVEGPVPETVGR